MPFASVLGESEAEALKRRMKERSAITSLDAPAKKENKRLCKELSLRFQRAKEKLEDGTKKLDKQVLSQQSLASDKTVKEDSVQSMVECVDEFTEIQKVLALAVEEGSGVAADFQEGKCSFTLTAEELKEVKKAKERRKKKKKRRQYESSDKSDSDD